MKIIKIGLEYKCFPVWIYDENNELIEYSLPIHLMDDADINFIFTHIQENFDSLYLDDGKEFKYTGFKDEEKRQDFFKELHMAINLLKSKLNCDYIIEENGDLENNYYYVVKNEY